MLLSGRMLPILCKVLRPIFSKTHLQRDGSGGRSSQKDRGTEGQGIQPGCFDRSIFSCLAIDFQDVSLMFAGRHFS